MPRTKWKLIGVFKETDGFEDFAEQLFKHQGYCVWDSDTYEAMQEFRENMVSGCRAIGTYIYGSYQYVYLDVKPLAEGNITHALYEDDQCTQESETTFKQFLISYYSYYYGDSSTGYEAYETTESNFASWNTGMMDYKVCQPCRAYDIGWYDNDENGSKDSHDSKDRFLGGDENDGEGDYEPYGHDCNDDAGYLNCNQVRNREDIQ